MFNWLKNIFMSKAGDQAQEALATTRASIILNKSQLLHTQKHMEGLVEYEAWLKDAIQTGKFNPVAYIPTNAEKVALVEAGVPLGTDT